MLFARSLRAAAPFLLPALGTFMACATAEPVERPGKGGETSGGSSNDSGGTATSGGVISSGGSSSVSGGTTGSGGTTTSKGGTTSSSGGTTTSKGGATGSGGTTSKGGATSSTGGTDTSLPYTEDFETPLGERWIEADQSGMWSVKDQDGSQAYVVVATEKTFSVGGSIEWTNVRVESKVKFVAAGSSPVIYLMARWADPKSYLVIEFRPGDTAGDLKLRQSDAGSTSDVCRYKPPAVVEGDWYTIGLSVSGSLATLLFDGMPVTADKPCTLPKANPAAGGIALGAADATAAFDDVSVKTP
jgi:hypothetical protein